MTWTAKQIYDLDNSMVAAQNVELGSYIENGFATYTAVSADASASRVILVAGVDTIEGCIVQIFRSGSIVTADAYVTTSGSKITVADGGSTYNVTTGDVFNYIVW